MRSQLSESQIRTLIEQELFYRSILEEGLWDDVLSGTKKMIKGASGFVSRFNLLNAAKDVLKTHKKLPDEVRTIIEAISFAKGKTGETIKFNEPLRLAAELGNLDSSKMGEILASDLKGPVHDKAKNLQSESRIKQEIHKILNEVTGDLITTRSLSVRHHHELNEAAPLGVVGLGLAGFGALIMLTKGLIRLSNFLNATRTEEVLKKTYSVLHSLEESMIDIIVPDTLSYFVYIFLRKRGFKLESNKRKRSLTFEEYQENKKARIKVEKLIYSGLLLFLAFNGIKTAINAGISLLGFAEGSASVVKSVEVGQAAAHIGDIIELGIEEM